MIDDKTQIERNGYILEPWVADLRKYEIVKEALRKRHPLASKKQIANWARFVVMKGAYHAKSING